MNAERIAVALMSMADQMTELANGLMSNGNRRSMTKRELSLCRAALVPAVQDILDSALIDFMQGVTCHERIAGELAELEIL